MIFLIVGFLSLVILFFTSRFVAFGSISLVSFFLYFIMAGNGNWITFILFLLGISLLILEIFIPDFGLVGILGIGSVILGYFMNNQNIVESMIDLGSALLIAVVATILFVRKGYQFLPGRNNLVLRSSMYKQRGYSSAKDYTQFLGKKGVAQTTLRPAGKAEVDGKILDVVSQGAVISEGAPIQVIHIEGAKIIVKEMF